MCGYCYGLISQPWCFSGSVYHWGYIFLCVEDNNHEKCLSSECILLPGTKSQRLRSRDYHMMNNLVTKFSILFCWGYLEGNMSSLIFIPCTNVFKKSSQNIQTLAWSWTVKINTGQITYHFCFPLWMRYEGISHTYTEEKKKNGLTAIKFSLKAKVWCTTELPLESWVRKTWICHFFLFPPLMFLYLCLWLHCWGIVWEWIHLFPHLSSHKGMRNTRASASFHLKGNNN